MAAEKQITILAWHQKSRKSLIFGSFFLILAIAIFIFLALTGLLSTILIIAPIAFTLVAIIEGIKIVYDNRSPQSPQFNAQEVSTPAISSETSEKEPVRDLSDGPPSHTQQVEQASQQNLLPLAAISPSSVTPEAPPTIIATTPSVFVQATQSPQVTPETEQKTEKKILIFHVNEYPDGLGDMGNLIDFSQKMLELLGKENVIPYFVITSMDNEKAVARLKSSMPSVDSNHVFTFEKNAQEVNAENFSKLVNSSDKLKEAYANADGVYFIATPFEVSEQIKSFLKPGIEPTTVTEHIASSYGDWKKRKSLPPYHYVTGIGEGYSGMMVTDLSSKSLSSSAEILLSISDKTYLSKLGLKELSQNEALDFLENTLVVPVYLGVSQVDKLRPLLSLILHSPLAKKYKKVVFHVSKSAYSKEHFNFNSNEILLEGENLPKFEMIIGHYFEDPSDCEKIYQLAPNGGVAVCSGDKSLELTVSSGLMPLYVAPMWKNGMSKLLINLFGLESPPHAKLLEFCASCGSYPTGSDVEDASCLLIQVVYDAWKTMIRPKLLENSFYHVMEKEIAPRCLGKNTADVSLINRPTH